MKEIYIAKARTTYLAEGNMGVLVRRVKDFSKNQKASKQHRKDVRKLKRERASNREPDDALRDAK
jgi:hypothetical protein